MKTFLKYFLLYIIITVIFLSSLIIVSYIPKDAIKDNVRESAEIMVKEGEGKSFKSLARTVFNDNSTDAIMLNLTYTIDEENRLESIIKARRNFVPGITEEIKNDMVGDLPHESETYLMTQELLDTVNGKKQVSYEYTRYWHGYIVILRILLVLFDITTIRWITQIILISLIVILMYYLKRNSSWKVSISLLLSFIATDLFVWIYTIQGMYVMIIAVAISVFIANKKINEKNINIWLFISGALTAYFDFLTTPLVSILLPIIVYTSVNNNETNIKKEIIRLIKNLFAWGFGYFGLWAAKWIIADILYNMETIILSIVQIYYRMGGIKELDVENFGARGLIRNTINSVNFLVIAIYSFLYMYAMWRVGSYKKGYFLSSEKLSYYFCYIITLVWYYVISEHSYQHFFFTYKTMLITVLAIMLIVLDDRNGRYIIKKEDKKENKND